MDKIKFIVDRTKTGYSAYHKEKDWIGVVTVGDTMAQLKANMVEAYNLYKEDSGADKITEDDLTITFDVASLFESYPEINARKLAKRVGINEQLLYQYINGHKQPSDKQVQKILAGLRQLALELLDFA